ncbi:MAG: tRNA (adenosine(37)-N6)-threonylcarbamoyltransferase complex ATPase subunit type 1 TsaE [Burkholderiales bacterium]|nr:tRNA (adenosine(37)-N6)-threonylcarbamoyltransferase complex ATPase subunit type 1 TsaE [Burkholderiales bacterium]
MQTMIRHLDDSSATRLLGEVIARAAVPGSVLTLHGDLGAGKTTLARGMLHGLGFLGAVKSPTYSLVEEYPLPQCFFYHFDFYRMRDPAEWDDSGLQDYFRANALCVIEWAEKAGDRLPPVDLALTLTLADQDENARTATIKALTPRGETWLAKIVQG